MFTFHMNSKFSTSETVMKLHKFSVSSVYHAFSSNSSLDYVQGNVLILWFTLGSSIEFSLHLFFLCLTLRLFYRCTVKLMPYPDVILLWQVTKSLITTLKIDSCQYKANEYWTSPFNMTQPLKLQNALCLMILFLLLSFMQTMIKKNGSKLSTYNPQTWPSVPGGGEGLSYERRGDPHHLA